MGYLCKYKVSRVEILQSWCAPRTTHHNSGYDVSIATYLLPDLYLLKRKNALFFLLSLTDFLVFVLSNAHIRSHPRHEQQGLIALLEGGKLRFYLLNGEGLEPITLPWKCHHGHIMELCGECNNCTKVQFDTEKIFRDIPFFVISHHFVSTLWHHKSSNLHKSKSWITPQLRVLSQ